MMSLMNVSDILGGVLVRLYREPINADYNNTVHQPISVDYNNTVHPNGTDLNESTVEDYDDYEQVCQMYWTSQNILIICMYTCIFCLSVVGNILVIVIITQQRWMRTITNVYLLNLAIADLLLAVVCMPATLISTLVKCFVFPVFVCPALAYLQPVSVTASLYTLTVITIERYNAICRPLQSRHWQTKSHALRMIGLVWLISLTCNLPHLFLLEAEQIRPGQWNCRPVFNDKNTIVINVINQGYVTTLLFVIPAVVMVVLYGLVICTLKEGMLIEKHQLLRQVEQDPLSQSPSPPRSKASSLIRNMSRAVRKSAQKYKKDSSANEEGNGELILMTTSCQSESGTQQDQPNNHNQLSVEAPKASGSRVPEDCSLRSTHAERSLANKKRVIVMLLAVVIEFFVCWTPIYCALMFIWICRWHIVSHADSYMRPWLISYLQSGMMNVVMLLCYVSSCCNPITYGFLNEKFRNAALYTIGCIELPASAVSMAPVSQMPRGGLTRLQPNEQHLTLNPQQYTNNNTSVNGRTPL